MKPDDSKSLMKLDFVYNGNPSRIPPIGSRIDVQQFTTAPAGTKIYFQVESYGEHASAPDPLYTSGEICTMELFGSIVIPTGSPMSVLESLWAGTLFRGK